jgi:hypothetical protein
LNDYFDVGYLKKLPKKKYLIEEFIIRRNKGRKTVLKTK